MNILEERYMLVGDRILSLMQKKDIQVDEKYHDYVYQSALLFQTSMEVFDVDHTVNKSRINQTFYRDLIGDNYETSFANPAHCMALFGEKIGSYLCWYYTQFRNVFVAAFEHDQEETTIYMELFMQVIGILEDGENIEKSLKENIYYFIHDYDEQRMEKNIKKIFCADQQSLIYQIVMNADLSTTQYLYEYGEYITIAEKQMASFLSSISDKRLESIAATYTEGFRKGFEVAGIDLSKKKTVQIRYHIGFEPLIRKAVLQFEQMGLTPVFTRKTNTKALGVYSTSPNKQYQYDHRFDDALYLNKALISQRLAYAEKIFETYKKEASEYAGPAVVEIFGERLFQPETKEESPAYTEEQEKLSIEYMRDYSLIQNKYIPRDAYSFTIIAYPYPEIGEKFEEIFESTIQVNTLDTDLYQEIQQALIDALDQGAYVQITGRGNNRTNLRVQLHELKNPSSETNFENCLADVNIPVGEVFTSPVLRGTNGILHVTHVYLNELRYENIEIKFQDGMIEEYSCTNYDTVEENIKYIKQNVLYNRETLPMGEFAIGTNTAAYVMGRKYGIEAQLPILIAEKTGPHFAVGDTCYSMSEDVVLHNPDGKEIIAKENECSVLRHTDPTKAYFNCHTDITIPYDELGDITVFTNEGKAITLIKNGRYVLPGTESLNDVFKEEL